MHTVAINQLKLNGFKKTFGITLPKNIKIPQRPTVAQIKKTISKFERKNFRISQDKK